MHPIIYAPSIGAPQYIQFSSVQSLSLLDSVGEGKGGMVWENGIETCIISYKKLIASPGSKQDNRMLGAGALG